MSDVIRSQQGDMEKKALQWTVATVDDEDDIETLVEGIPGYITAGTSKKNVLSIIQDLLDTYQPTWTPHQPAHRHVHPQGATAAPPRTCAGVGPSSAWTPHGS